MCDNSISIWTHNDFCAIDDSIWFTHGSINCLIEYNFSKKEIRYIDMSDLGDVLGYNLYTNIFYHENRLYLIPRKANDLVIYDIKNMSFTSINIGDYKLRVAYKVGKLIYGVTENVDCIIKFDIENCTIVKEIKLFKKTNKSLICGEIWEDENNVVIPSYSYGEIETVFVIFNKNNESVNYLYSDVQCNGFSSICVYNNKIYGQGLKDKALYEIDFNTGKMLRKVYDFEESIYIIGIIEKKLFFSLKLSRNYKYYDFENNEFYDSEFLCEKNNNLFDSKECRGLLKNINSFYIFFDCYNGIIYKIEKNKKEAYKPYFNEQVCKNINLKIKESKANKFSVESVGYNLPIYIEQIKNLDGYNIK